MNTQKPFALIEKDGIVTEYHGELHTFGSLAELQAFYRERVTQTCIFMNPFNTIRERGSGFIAHGNEPILALAVESQKEYTREQVMGVLLEKDIELEGAITPSLTHEEYARMVEAIKEEEIGRGTICQMILSQSYHGKVGHFSESDVLAAYRNLLKQRGQYMTFLFGDGQGQYFIGASPEQHVGIEESRITMIPIAGTLRKKDPNDLRPLKVRLLEFLKNPKEIQELFHVLDEELKMMEVVSSGGGRIEGPFLRQNGAVIHTEYLLIGKRGNMDPIDALRHTLHAPTLVGGPEQSASRIIYEREKESRGYYGGEIGILKGKILDSAILIRMAHLQKDGTFTIRAGAGIVHDSDPISEAEEIRLKTAGMQSALLGNVQETEDVSELLNDPEVLAALAERNRNLSSFHFEDQSGVDLTIPELMGKTVTIIHNDDDFSYTLGRMMHQMGMTVDIVRNEDYEPRPDDILVIGGGPGDINDMSDLKMNRLRSIIQNRGNLPLLGICLGCQAICQSLGIPVKRLQTPLQGIQREVLLDGTMQKVGHYNSFAGLGTAIGCDIVSKPEDGSIDMIHSQEKRVLGVQFHPESVMTQNGREILKKLLLKLIK